jgi:hypothetical protein
MELLSRTCRTEEMNTTRLFARIFVIVGGLFWIFMVWGAAWAYQGAPFTEALSGALIYAVGIAAIFVVGLFYENVASVILAVGAVAIVVYGVIGQWEAGVWATVFFFFILPMLIASALYAMAARMQKICTDSAVS